MVSRRKLGEFLQEQQEPFILEVYLVERGCKKQRYLESPCSSTKSTRCMKNTSAKFGLKGCSTIVRNLFGKIIIQNSGNKNGRVGMSEETDSRKQKKQQSNKIDEQFLPRFVLDDSVLVDEKQQVGVGVGWKFTTWRSKQLSPVSVLDETESYDCSPNEIEQLTQKVSECKLENREGQEVDNTNIDNDGSNTSFQFNRNKKALQQAKHLLFDCLLEVVDSRSPELIGSEQLRQLMSELCSKEVLNESSINHVTSFNALASDKTLKNCEEQRQEIGMVVGDMILEDIYNEFFTDMIGNFSS